MIVGVLRPGRELRHFWGTATMLLGRRDDATPFVAPVSWDEGGRPRQ